MTEQEAIRRLKRGDIGGLALLVEHYQLQAVRTAFLITHDNSLAEDVVQDVFLQVYRHAGSFDLQRPFAPWFLRCVVNAALRAAKEGQYEVSLDDSAIEAGANNDALTLSDLLSTPDTDPEMETEVAETEAMIEEALRRLAPEHRAAVVMRYYLDLSDSEMSAALHCAPGTVRWRLHTARKQLKNYLQRVLVTLLIS